MLLVHTVLDIEFVAQLLNQEILGTTHKRQPQILYHVSYRERTKILDPRLLYGFHQEIHQLNDSLIEVVVVGYAQKTLRDLCTCLLMKGEVHIPVGLRGLFHHVGALILVLMLPDETKQLGVVLLLLQNNYSIGL